MPVTKSALPGTFGASLVAASGPLRAMSETTPPTLGVLGAPGWPFHPRNVRATQSSLHGINGAPLAAAAFFRRAMRDANSPPDGIVGAPLAAAALLRRAVPVADPSLNHLVGAILATARFARRTVRDATPPPAGDVGAAPAAAALPRAGSDVAGARRLRRRRRRRRRNPARGGRRRPAASAAGTFGRSPVAFRGGDDDAPRTVPLPRTSPLGVLGAPLVTAYFPRRAVRGARPPPPSGSWRTPRGCIASFRSRRAYNKLLP